MIFIFIIPFNIREFIFKFFHHFFSGNHLGVYYCLYNVPAEYECVAVEESKLYGINKIEFLKLLKNYPEIEEHMREIQYTKYRSVKNQMDNGIRKELNEFNNSINDVHNKIEFKVKEMVDFNGNKNGMNINNCLKKEIKKREERIKNLEEILNKKYDEGKKG